MSVAEAQREVRSAFLGGFVGQLISALLWCASAAVSTWGAPRQGILVLIAVGFFIFPLTQLGLRLIGRPGKLRPENPLGALGFQVAVIMPLLLPVVGAAALYRLNWFYPAAMIALGAHYLPFATLYGMRMFLALGALLVLAGLALGLYMQESFSAGAWITSAFLLVFAVLGRAQVLREERTQSATGSYAPATRAPHE